MLKYEVEKRKAGTFLALTGVKVAEFEALIEPFGVAWEARMKGQTMDGRKREERSHSDYANNPLPSAAEKLLFILVYLKQAPTQVVQGALFEMSQSNANKWIHLLLPVLDATLTELAHAPARRNEVLHARWQSLQPEPAPLFFTTAPTDRSSDRATPQATVTVANTTSIP